MTETTESKKIDEVYTCAKRFFDDEGDKESHVVELLAPYLKVRPTHAYAWAMYGDSLRILGRDREALPALKKALELAPRGQEGYICARIGMLYSSTSSPIEAEKWYEKAMQKNEEILGWMWIFRGTNLTKIGEFLRAIECFREALKWDDVDKEESFLNIGNVLRAMGNYSEAIEAFKKALEIDPNYSEAQAALEGLQGIQDTQALAAQIKSST